MLHVQMYHTKTFEDRELSIKGDPYKHKLVQELLIEMGVVFYRDEEHSYNALETTNNNNGDVKAYYSQVVFNEETWAIDKWSRDRMKQSNKTFKDAFVWLRQNQPVTIKCMTKTTITSRTR